MNKPFLRRILIFTDETVESQRSLEKLLPEVFAPVGYEVHTYDLYHVRKSGIKIEEIIDLVKPQTVLWQLSLPFEQRLKEFLDAERLKSKETRFILLSPVNENIIDRTLESQFGDYCKPEIVMMPFSIDGLVKKVSSETQFIKEKERE